MHLSFILPPYSIKVWLCEIYIVEPERMGIYNIENIQLFDYIAPHTLYANFRQIVSIQFIVFVCGFKCCWPITIYCGFHRNRNANNCLTIEQFLLNVKQHQQKKNMQFHENSLEKMQTNYAKSSQKMPQAIEEKKFARKYFTIFPFCACVCIFRNYGMLLVQCSYSIECVIISFMCNTYATRAKCFNLRYFHLKCNFYPCFTFCKAQTFRYREFPMGKIKYLFV